MKGGAAKRVKANSGAAVPVSHEEAVGEIRYDNPKHAAQALAKLNGKPLKGSVLNIEKDENSRDGAKLIITGISDSVQWQDLKDHFGKIGTVAFADVQGGGRNVRVCMGEVRFEDESTTQQAMDYFQGSTILGYPISLRLCPLSKDSTKILVDGVPTTANWKDLKDHFKSMGPQPIFADLKKSQPSDEFFGEVRYDDPEHAQLALQKLNGSTLQGRVLKISLDGSSTDASKLRVTNLSYETQWQELKDHFKEIGTVAFVNIHNGRGKGKGKGGKGQMVSVPAAMMQMMMGMGGAQGGKGAKGGKGKASGMKKGGGGFGGGFGSGGFGGGGFGSGGFGGGNMEKMMGAAMIGAFSQMMRGGGNQLW